MSTEQDLAALINCKDSKCDDQKIFRGHYLDIDQAEFHGVLPLLQFKLAQLEKEQKADQKIDRSIIDRITRYSHHCAASEMQLAAGYKHALTLIESHDPVILKGAVMAYHYYPQPHHRPMVDVDILIAENTGEIIRKLLVENGFDLVSSNAGEIVLTQFSCTKMLSHCLTLHLDIHSKLFNRPGMHDLLDYDEIRAEARRITVYSQEFLVPSACHCLIHACLHLMAHHENSRRLIWLYDIKLILEKFTEIDREQLLAFTHSKRIAIVILTAINACNTVFPLGRVALNSELERQSNDQAENAHPATRLLHKHSPATLLLSDWGQIKGMENRLKWLKEHLFPKPEYIREKYGVQYSPLILIFYVWRIIGGSVRLFTRKTKVEF